MVLGHLVIKSEESWGREKIVRNRYLAVLFSSAIELPLNTLIEKMLKLEG